MEFLLQGLKTRIFLLFAGWKLCSAANHTLFRHSEKRSDEESLFLTDVSAQRKLHLVNIEVGAGNCAGDYIFLNLNQIIVGVGHA